MKNGHIEAIIKQVAECLRLTKHPRDEWYIRDEGWGDIERVTAWIEGDPDQTLLTQDCAFAYHWGRLVSVCEFLELTPLQLLDEVSR